MLCSVISYTTVPFDLHTGPSRYRTDSNATSLLNLSAWFGLIYRSNPRNETQHTGWQINSRANVQCKIPVTDAED